jgi:hypothetical protein
MFPKAGTAIALIGWPVPAEILTIDGDCHRHRVAEARRKLQRPRAQPGV